jgi:hypothetical protein
LEPQPPGTLKACNGIAVPLPLSTRIFAAVEFFNLKFGMSKIRSSVTQYAFWAHSVNHETRKGATAWRCGINNRAMGFALFPYLLSKKWRLPATGAVMTRLERKGIENI